MVVDMLRNIACRSVLALLTALGFGWLRETPAALQSDALPAPLFHHLHLNSTNPDKAIEFYTRQFPSTSRASWAGLPALRSPNNVLLVFTTVRTPPPTEPQTAIWHFGWHVTDVRARMEEFKRRKDVRLLPLYTTDEGGSVFISSDAWPVSGSVLGLTRAEIDSARAAGVKPPGGPGFAYLQGPDHAIVEYQGNFPAERFNHVHLYQEDPFCAQIWYQKHLLGAGRVGVTTPAEAACKVPRASAPTWPALEKEGTFRTPSAGVTFGDVALNWYARQGDRPLASTKGQLADHIALSVTDLDLWLAKLRREGVAIAEQPRTVGDTRTLMVEGPSREVIELVELKAPRTR
jgi:catechol 2,3-dioxygenase-like lactoylglutathione lyase family enzyme